MSPYDDNDPNEQPEPTPAQIKAALTNACTNAFICIAAMRDGRPADPQHTLRQLETVLREPRTWI